MQTIVAIELPEGTYLVTEERLREQTSAEVLVWLRDSWRAIRRGGRAANDTRAVAQQKRRR
ncbi:MAG: hypothetical protein WCJ30_01395 [Deltaproteobacteria bacterium]